jgi:hypothetical protein
MKFNCLKTLILYNRDHIYSLKNRGFMRLRLIVLKTCIIDQIILSLLDMSF